MIKKLQAPRLLLNKEYLINQISLSVLLQLLHHLHLTRCKAKVDVAGVDYHNKGVKAKNSYFTTVDDSTQHQEKTATVSQCIENFNELNSKGLADNKITCEKAKDVEQRRRGLKKANISNCKKMILKQKQSFIYYI